MQGKATISGHPIHPILVTLPIGCFVAAVVSDIISIGAGTAFWATMATWLLAFGIAGALLAAFFGFVDYLSAPMSAQAKSIANWHFALNLGMVVIFGVSFAVRYFDHTHVWGYVTEIVGIVMLAVSGILGGSLAHRHLVGSSEQDLATVRSATDESSLSPQERLTRDREIARSAPGRSPKGTI